MQKTGIQPFSLGYLTVLLCGLLLWINDIAVPPFLIYIIAGIGVILMGTRIYKTLLARNYPFAIVEFILLLTVCYLVTTPWLNG